jgi:hypothetical protein
MNEKIVEVHLDPDDETAHGNIDRIIEATLAVFDSAVESVGSCTECSADALMEALLTREFARADLEEAKRKMH